MTIRGQGGVFGRNPIFNDVDVQGDASVDGQLSLGDKIVINGNAIGGTQVFIADDAVATISAPRYGGWCFLMVRGDSTIPQLGNLSGVFGFDAGSSVGTVPIFAGSNFARTTGVLTGTTGLDGNVTISPQTNQTIQVENRSGTSVNFQLTFI